MTTKKSPKPDKVVPTADSHDCGGRCLLKAHVREGKIIRIETDDGDEPQCRACLKGRAYRQMVYSPDRLKFPMRRVGARGEGKFERISWDEALDTVASELKRVKETYGPAAILFIAGSGSVGVIHFLGELVRNLLNLFGGCTNRWGSPSAEGSRFSSKATFGTLGTAHTREDLANSRLIIMWGWNPAVSIQGTNTRLYLAQAREAGTRIICVDPRYTESALAFAHQWIPIRPGTDTAMIAAMAHVMIKDDLPDQRFLDTYAVGFDKFKDYVLGKEDGVAKTPAWAESITGVPARTIENLAREYATTRPAALMTGFAPGRTAYGEQYHRAAATLAAMTGNIGIHGGNPAGHGLMGGGALPQAAPNPVEPEAAPLYETLDSHLRSPYRVQTAKVWDALLRGKAQGYPSDFKLVYITSSNCLNQYLNANKGAEALKKPEFIVIHEQFMTATARFSDIVLPVTTCMERNDIGIPGYPQIYSIYMQKAVAPLDEAKSDLDIVAELAPRLGITGLEKREDERLGEIVGALRATRGLPDYDEFKRQGIHKVQLDEPLVAFKAQIEDPTNNPFPTPSGKIEIYCQRLADLNDPGIPPVPKYIETWESASDPLTEKYPLQLISAHSRRRANSCFDHVPWLRETEPQSVMINTADAQARGIINGEPVRVFNDRGEIIVPARLTGRIIPGAVEVNQGAWFAPDERGIDRGGCPNTLTRDEYSPGGAFPSNTCLVQVEKVSK